MRQAGFVILPILIAAVILLSGTVIYLGRGVWTYKEPVDVESVSPSPEAIETPAPSPTPIKSAAPVATKRPVPTSTPKQANSCGITVMSEPGNDKAVKLIYSASSTNGSYMTGAQWDFDGNGTWDTDMSQSNGTYTKTYSANGTYSVKLQLKMSDGSTTGVCSKSVSIPTASTTFSVKLTGRVYADANCNDTQEPSETGVPGVTINIDQGSSGIYATVTSDSNGYYEFKTDLGFGGSLTFQPAHIAASGYKIFYSSHTVSLNQYAPTANIDLPQVPGSNIGSCPI